MIDGVLNRLGVVPCTFWALYSAQLTLVFRSPIYGRVTASPADSIISPWFWVVGQNLLIGAMASLVLFARVDAFFFALCCLTVSALVTLASMAVEFNETVFNPDDQEVLAHLPIPSRTYAAVRLAGLATFVLTTVLSVNLFPAIVGAWLRDAPSHFVIGYLLAALALNSLIVGVLIGVMTWSAKRFTWAQVQEVAGWVPTGLILVLFYGGQFALRDKSQRLAYFAYDLPEWILWTPVAWLAATFTPAPEGIAWLSPWSLVVWCGSALIVWGAVLSGLARFYEQWHLRAVSGRVDRYLPLANPGSLVSGWQRVLLRDRISQAGFWFASVMMQRDSNARLRCWTSFSFAAAPLLLGWLGGELRDPWRVELARAATSVAAVHLLAFSVPGVLAALRYSRDHEAAWIFQVMPVSRVSALYDGIAWLLLLRFYLPIVLLMTILWAWVWQSPLHAIVHASIGLLSAFNAYYLALTIGGSPVPFSGQASTNQWSADSAKLGIVVAAWVSLATGIHVGLIAARLPLEILPVFLLGSLIAIRLIYRQANPTGLGNQDRLAGETTSQVKGVNS